MSGYAVRLMAAPIMLSHRPARAICAMVIRPLAEAMALGGVATGSMKAQLAAIASGTANTVGGRPRLTAIAAANGRKVAALAVLLVISVRKIIPTVATAMIRITSQEPSPDIVDASQSARPEDSIAAANVRPPPNCHCTPHCKAFKSFQVSRRPPLGMPEGR